MLRFLSRFRFPLASLAVALLASVLHLGVSFAPVHPTAEVHGAWATTVHALQKLEGQLQDLHMELRGKREPDPRVVVVAIDEKSVQEFGRWPWSREVFARGLEALHRAGPAAIGLDLLFVDRDRADKTAAYQQALESVQSAAKTNPSLAQSLSPLVAELRSHVDASGDAALADAFGKAPEVVQAVAPFDGDSVTADVRAEWNRTLEPFVLRGVPVHVPGAKGDVVRMLPASAHMGAAIANLEPPLPAFASRVHHLGQIAVIADADGVLRGLPLLAQTSHPGLLPSLGLETAAVALGARIEPVYDRDLQRIVGVDLFNEDHRVGSVPLPSNDDEALLSYPGPRSVFPTYSFADVVDGKVPAAALKGKAVLVGVTLLAQFDQIVTPFERVTPGVYSHATLLSNILSGDHLFRDPSMPILEVLFLLAVALAFGFVLPRFGVAIKAGAGIAAALIWFGAAQVAFDHGHVWATLLPCLGTALSAQAIILVGYLTVDREKGRLKGAFSHYLNPSVMDQMLAHPEKLKLGGEKKDMTVLFSDIRGFTTLAERMAPEALVKFINSYLTPMTEIVLDEAGTLDKYIGDAVMAFWGAPLDQEDHALRACRAALRFVQKVEELKAQWRAQGLPEFDIGVGINSGAMIVGNMGSDVRFDYTVMGDAVNLASRLEGTNKEYGTRLMISEATYEKVKGQVSARRLGAVRVKGKRKPVRIYELRGLQAEFGKDAEAIASFEAAVDAWAAQRFEEAAEGFRKTLALWPEDGPSQRYLEEIEGLKQRPPGPGWDGVYVATTK